LLRIASRSAIVSGMGSVANSSRRRRLNVSKSASAPERSPAAKRSDMRRRIASSRSGSKAQQRLRERDRAG
jgi:hypothetical protein